MALLDAVRDGAVAASPDVDAEVYRLAPAQVPWALFSPGGSCWISKVRLMASV